MPITVKQNKNGGYAVLRATSTETVSLGELAASNETIQSASIAEIMWSADSTNRWTVKRGGGGTGNNVAVLAGSGHHDYQVNGMRIETSSQLTSNTTVTLSGGNGYIVVKFHKVSGE